MTKAELELPTTEEYLGGVCDLTGEIGRFAVQRASKRDTAAVERCRYLVDAIQGEVGCLQSAPALTARLRASPPPPCPRMGAADQV